MQEWRQDEIARRRLARKTRASLGTFEGDAKRYLKIVTALPSYTDRAREIRLWIDVFGTQRRDTITSAEIRAQRDAWLVQPRSDTDARPVAPATVNKRLRALSNLWRVLDGPAASNPVREVPEVQVRRAAPRRLSYADIDRIIGAMASHAGGQWTRRPTPADYRPSKPSLARVRVRILAETGISLSTLKRLKPADVSRGRVIVPPRQKGQGADGVVLPLTALASAAFTDLATLNGFGPFSSRSLRRAFHTACRSVGLTARLHDLRHAFLTAVAVASGDEGAVGAIGQHGDVRTTRGYIEASVDFRVQAAMAAFAHARGTTFRDDAS